MNDNGTLKVLIISITVGLVCLMLGLMFVPSVRAAFNINQYQMHKVDDSTRYATRKRVEDEARSLVASYNNDKLRYEQYKTSTDKTQLEWAEQAKMRANQSATIFNEFILKNSFVFEGNIPADINYQLQLLK